MVDYKKLLNDFKNYNIDPATLPDLCLAILQKFGYDGDDDPIAVADKQAFVGTRGSEKAIAIVAATQDDAVKGISTKELAEIKGKYPGKVVLLTNYGVGVAGSSMRNDYPNIKIKKIPTAMSELKEGENLSEARSIGKVNIKKLNKIILDEWTKNNDVAEDEITEKLPTEWWDTWESADSQIRRIIYDQLMSFGWKRLLPLALLNTVITAVVAARG